MKNDLIRLKASVLALIMCLGLSGCGSSEREIKHDSDVVSQESFDDEKYLIAFIEGKAVIYAESDFSYSSTSGFASIFEDDLTMKFIQTPCIVLTGKENCVRFASSIVGEENIIFLDFTDNKNQEIILIPNN